MRRTPLARTSGLARTGMPRERRPLRPVSKRRRKRDKGYNRQRERVFERAGGQCELFVHAGLKEYGDGLSRCPSPMDDVHHIGGRLGPDPHRLDNLLGLCRWHHDLVHANPEWARAVGAMRSRLGGAA